ncbi:MAG: adenosylcobinamide-GDP ribazoletransferase [Gemmatimonadaceae bacterium]|nr:adenosylcobinamide-GDP ribazoletransferase [Gemmatimonadaceae bacterium]
MSEPSANAVSPSGGLLAREARALASACTFLTRLPAWRFVAHDTGDLPRSAAYFPLIGALVGGVGATVLAAGLIWWTPLVAATLSTIATVRFTGAFHEDALADSLDGFGGGWDREQVLAIMKDSRVGSYALVGMCLALLLKCATLTEVATTGAVHWSGMPLVARVLVAAHAMGRCASVWLIAVLPYVRPASATPDKRESAGRPFVNGVSRWRVLFATIATLVIGAACLGQSLLVVMLVAVVGTILAGRYFRRRIGGITGDALGAVNQVVEVLVYLTITALPTTMESVAP